MARYCTQDDLLKQVREDVLLDLADDDRDGQVDDAVVTAAIESASDLVDGYCGPRYSVPFDPVPGVVRRLSTDLAVYNLFARRGFDMQSADRAVVERYRDAIRFFEKVAEGKVAIGIGSNEPHTPPTKTSVASRPQVFSDDVLERF